MTRAVVGSGLLAPAPSIPWLVLAVVAIAVAITLHALARRAVLPPLPQPAPVISTLRAESPAVVNMLTNDATVTAAAMRATMIDLAARGWLRILPPDDLDELARVRPAATAAQGDALAPHERLVVQHVMARFTTDRAIPARFLAVDIRASWWRRFAGLVTAEAERAGLATRRWTPATLAAPAGAWAVAALCTMLAWAAGSDTTAVIDSVTSRIVWWSVLALLIALGLQLVGELARPSQTLTAEGVTAARTWLAVRQRLDETGFSDLAPSAGELGDRRLSYATAMCLAEGAVTELPLAREDHRIAWSSVGGRAHLVRVQYPYRLAYGMAPWSALGVGVVVCFAGLQLRRWSSDVARQEAFDWIYERFSAQSWLIADLATALTFLAYVPIVGGLWMAVAGAADAFNTVERTGAVIRARRPAEVSPLPRRIRRWLERERYHVYLAVDDGSRDTVVAWKATEQQAIPQGARATVRATPVLGHVRRASPVGHRLGE